MRLSIIVPVYMEEENILVFLNRILPVLKRLTNDFEIIFALDPSSDRSKETIFDAHQKDPRIKCLEFSRRFGQPLGTLAGLQYSSGDATIVMDVDLQDPPELLPELVARWREGFDVVYAQRRSRDGQPWINRIVTRLGYALMHLMASGLDIPENTGDFRLLSRRAVNEILKLKESHGFLRGMTALIGFRQSAVSFDRPRRLMGKGHYNPLFGSLRIGINGLVCFSSYPLMLSTWLGFAITFCSLILAIAYLLHRLCGFPFPLGNAAITILVMLLSGIQLISVGILGEYIARIYDEVKQRPRFIVEHELGFDTTTPTPRP
jgi:dolichol-phosphate mannosyltransferase